MIVATQLIAMARTMLGHAVINQPYNFMFKTFYHNFDYMCMHAYMHADNDISSAFFNYEIYLLCRSITMVTYLSPELSAPILHKPSLSLETSN